MFVVGEPGDGKSVIGQKLLQHYQSQGFEPYCVTSVDEFFQCWTLQPNKPLVILVDDVFGKLNFTPSDAAHWCQIRQICTVTAGKSKLIFTSRRHLYAEFCEKFVTQRESVNALVLNLSDTNSRLTTEDKYEMLQGFCDANNVNIIVRELKSIASNPGNTTSYPFACKFFTSVGDFRKRGGEFFTKPIEILQEYIETLRQTNKTSYFCLVVLMLSGGQLQVSSLDASQTEEQQARITAIATACGLQQGSCPGELKKCLLGMKGVLLYQDDTTHIVEFSHEIAEEAVVVNFGSHNPQELLTLCSAAFIQQHVNATVSTTGLVIQIQPSMYKILAKRFLLDILEDNAEWVFKNPVVCDINFQKIWCKVFSENLPLMHKILEKEKHCWSQVKDGKLKVDWNGPLGLMKDKTTGKSVTSVFCWAVYSGAQVILDFLMDRVEQFLPVETLKGTSLHGSIIPATKGRQTLKEATPKKILKSLVLQAEIQNCTRPSFIHIAAGSGDLDMLSILLQHQVAITTKDSFGLTPTLCAAMHGHAEAVKLLLKSSDAALVARDTFGRGLLYLASLHGMLEIAEIIIFKGAVTSKESRDSYGITPLHLSASRGDNELTMLLIKQGFDIRAKDFQGCTPLHHSSGGGFEKTVKIILDADADVNALDKSERSALHHASRAGADKAVSLLLERGGSVSTRDKDGNTALHLAAQFGHCACVTALTEKGAGTDEKNASGWSPLHLAAQEGRNDCIRMLVKAGVSVGQVGGEGETALHCAASYGHVNTVLILLELGASLSARDDRGWTPLHSATWIEQEQIVALLLDKGANPADKTITGRTALDFAELWHSKDMVQLMMDKLADEWC